ncbi:MAG: DedA family protein [Actinomycetales bacterium]
MDLLTWFPHMMGELNHLIEHSANAWWIIPLVSLFCLIDGFFLFLPSETAIVALASLSARFGEPNVWLLLLGGAAGAIAGDNIAYLLGRRLGTSRFAWMRRPRAARAFAWAGKELEKRGAVLIFTARYIPVGRIAVNFTAGATRFSRRQFVALDAVAALTWAGYSVAIGVFAGGIKFLHHNPLGSIGIAIVFAIVMGFLVDHAMKLLHRWLDRRQRDRGAAAGDGPRAGTDGEHGNKGGTGTGTGTGTGANAGTGAGPNAAPRGDGDAGGETPGPATGSGAPKRAETVRIPPD